MYKKLIIEKIASVLNDTNDSHLLKLTEMLDKAERVFIAGAGRSKLVGNFLAMRLMHGGYDVYVVGEIVTTSIGSKDLLIVISGSGETKQLIAYTERARGLGADIALISANNCSTIAKLAGWVFQIGNSEQYQKIQGMPLGTIFELSALIFLEALIAHIICAKNISEETMSLRHANLE
jgi:6-phospho 3-hexuloisomerase